MRALVGVLVEVKEADIVEAIVRVLLGVQLRAVVGVVGVLGGSSNESCSGGDSRRITRSDSRGTGG